VEGNVLMDRAGEGPERAILNTPIVEGASLLTGSDGLAEVEFENQSALRLTENSQIKFSQLLMNDAGAKVNQIQVIKGLVYLDAASKGDDVYRLTVNGTSLLVRRDTAVRLDAAPDKVQVTVFKGDVQLENQPQPVSIRKNETLNLDPKDASAYTIAKGTEPERFDKWNKEREEYGKSYAQNQGYGGPSHAYGLQDLNYYGSFFFANGYGYVWQPFGFANAMTSWDPYSNGAWVSYPGAGYMWASSYPWGWLPYHYGSWAYLNGAGWAWVPGGHYNNQWSSTGFQPVPRITKAPVGWTAAAPPNVLPASSNAPTVLVGKAAVSQAAIPGGRIQPTFGSVIPGRNVGANAVHGFASAGATRTAGNHTVFASPNTGFSAVQHGSPGHVFAQPIARPVGFEPEGVGHMGGGRGMGQPSAVMAPSAGAHGSPAGSAHK
jgi:hypothetical protein